MSPAAPTRPDATINATDEATAPPLDDALAARGEAPATPRATGTRVDAARSAEIAAAFDEIAPVYDRLTTILSLGLDRRWRAAVVAETRLRPGDSAIDVAAGTGKLATELADRVGPFGRIVAVDLSPAWSSADTAADRDIVQLEFVLGDAPRPAVRRRPVRRGDDRVRARRRWPTRRGYPRAAPRRPTRRPRRLPRADDAAATVVGPGLHRTANRLAPLAVSVAGRRVTPTPARGADAERAGCRFARRPDAAAGPRRRPLPAARAGCRRDPRGEPAARLSREAFGPSAPRARSAALSAGAASSIVGASVARAGVVGVVGVVAAVGGRPAAAPRGSRGGGGGLLDAVRLDRPPGSRQDRRDPAGLAALLGLGDVVVPPGQIGHDEPGQRRAETSPTMSSHQLNSAFTASAAERGGREEVMRGPV